MERRGSTKGDQMGPSWMEDGYNEEVLQRAIEMESLSGRYGITPLSAGGEIGRIASAWTVEVGMSKRISARKKSATRERPRKENEEKELVIVSINEDKLDLMNGERKLEREELKSFGLCARVEAD